MTIQPAQAMRAIRGLRKSMRSLRKNPSPEQVHKLRTGIRRVEAVIRAFELDRKVSGRLLLRAVKPIRKLAGEVRDFDVHTGFARTLVPAAQDDCLIQLMEYLGAHRVRSAQKLQRKVSSRNNEIRRLLKRCAKHIRQNAADRPTHPPACTATAAALDLWTEISEWPPLTSANLHPMRLKVKTLRYILELGDEEHSKLLKTLGEVKDAIGEWHDWSELARTAERELHQDSRCPLLQHLRSTARSKQKQAIAAANSMRRRFPAATLSSAPL